MKKKSSRPTTSEIKTGHRGNPAIEGPRDRTVCFMVSEREKIAVDRVAFCIQLTRSGVLARIVSEFIAAANEGRAAKEAERKLGRYLGECRKAVKKRGAIADKTIASMRGHDDE